MFKVSLSAQLSSLKIFTFHETLSFSLLIILANLMIYQSYETPIATDLKDAGPRVQEAARPASWGLSLSRSSWRRLGLIRRRRRLVTGHHAIDGIASHILMTAGSCAMHSCVIA